MESALMLWMEDMRRRKLTLTGPIVQDKAYKIQSKIASKQGKTIEKIKFTASTGWLYQFMKRIGTKNIAVTGEAASANYGAIEEMKKQMKDLVTEMNYSPQWHWWANGHCPVTKTRYQHTLYTLVNKYSFCTYRVSLEHYCNIVIQFNTKSI